MKHSNWKRDVVLTEDAKIYEIHMLCIYNESDVVSCLGNLGIARPLNKSIAETSVDANRHDLVF